MLDFEPSGMALVANWLAQNAPVLVAGFLAGVVMATAVFVAALAKLRRDGVI